MFPAGAHYDWCDALAMALNHLRADAEPGFLTWARLESAASLVHQGQASMRWL